MTPRPNPLCFPNPVVLSPRGILWPATTCLLLALASAFCCTWFVTVVVEDAVDADGGFGTAVDAWTEEEVAPLLVLLFELEPHGQPELDPEEALAEFEDARLLEGSGAYSADQIVYTPVPVRIPNPIIRHDVQSFIGFGFPVVEL